MEKRQSSKLMFTKIFGISMLGWLNILLFQWLFIRLTYVWVMVDPEKTPEARTDEFWNDETQSYVPKTFYHYSIMGLILPLSGWVKVFQYVWLFKFKFRISKVKEYYE